MNEEVKQQSKFKKIKPIRNTPEIVEFQIPFIITDKDFISIFYYSKWSFILFFKRLYYKIKYMFIKK